MSRTDRLMRLMDAMRRLPAPVTAARLAEETGVSQRQLYRDIATLRAGGALIDGEAGLGYTLTEDPALPPQSFSRLEIEALRLAVEALGRIGDDELTEAGRDALARIVATLPERQSRQALHAIMRSFQLGPDRAPPRVDLGAIRQACWDEEALRIDYHDLKGARTRRVIWPLGLSYSEHTLMLLAHCRLRMDFRVFHVNRIEALERTGDSFRPHRVPLVREYAQSRRHQELHEPRLR
ncbi:helix-turn-helix transcriptional regulator [Paracoccus siganidrum]|uniref:YafY family transcriptional regulator n=1 Tax=Paracoccus siganidrum TaxID=1276757 RepID=A0A419A565_9RHOB|nr:YafY family protein [Paracoccus siganidrum]RJL10279.1 YafY family transcriptional regulator [Paracoccus siganidrum]RMC37006.1 transcriptional regulator [Paracoccus siganidrum]